MNPNAFPPIEIEGVYRAIRERRDMRPFLATPIDPAQLERFVGAAHNAPSVGLMQPWRFIRIADRQLRQQIHAHVDQERVLTAHALGQRADEFMRLKIEGILACAAVLVVGLMDERKPYVFGRRAMPQAVLSGADARSGALGPAPPVVEHGLRGQVGKPRFVRCPATHRIDSA
jgi:5,6-dimethylbenzimidazole synthase